MLPQVALLLLAALYISQGQSMSIENSNPPNSGVRYITIENEDNGQRLDNYLLKILKGVPKSHIYRLLRKGEVRINKGRVKPETRLVAGSVLRLPPIRIAERPAVPVPGQRLQASLRAATLFEDEAMLIINKPEGLAVHGGSGQSGGVIEALRVMRPEDRFLELVHRLDRDTSGCLMLARKRAALKSLHGSMLAQKIEKQYLALVKGRWPKGRSTINAPLLKRTVASGERVVRADAQGKPAVTHYQIEETFADATLMRVILETGRTHQIRVHSQLAGHPLAGDPKYGDDLFNSQMREAGLGRMFLHAASLRLRHPVSGETLTVEAPLPEALGKVLAKLRLENK